MAVIQADSIVITFSKLVKDTDPDSEKSIINDETLDAIIQVAQELVGDRIIVEASKQ